MLARRTQVISDPSTGSVAYWVPGIAMARRSSDPPQLPLSGGCCLHAPTPKLLVELAKQGKHFDTTGRDGGWGRVRAANKGKARALSSLIRSLVDPPSWIHCA